MDLAASYVRLMTAASLSVVITISAPHRRVTPKEAL